MNFYTKMKVRNSDRAGDEEQRNEEIRQYFSDHNLRLMQRGHLQLRQGAGFALPCDRARDQGNGDQLEDQTDHSGYDIIHKLQARVVKNPGPDLPRSESRVECILSRWRKLLTQVNDFGRQIFDEIKSFI